MFKTQSTQEYQPKFTSLDGYYWYKEDLKGGEALAEVLVSTFLKSCNYLDFQDFVSYDFKYTASNMIELYTCVSPNFLQEGEQFI